MENRTISFFENRQMRMFALVFALLLAALAAAYYYFLRTDYIVLFSDLRAADASVVVQELDKKGTPYELRDNGSTIVVPENQAAGARVALAGSDLSAKGMVGFELFNESDMGLTDFAQRVNYQRALQGELARTIMTMDGIESARVHLAMPERTLFRANQAGAKAAITVIVKKGGHLDEGRVAGIQGLVAAAVPDLSLNDVVVLDEMGRTISSAASAGTLTSPQSEERGAMEQYYHARARQAVQNVLGSQPFELRVIAIPDERSGTRPGIVEGAALGGPANFRLRIVLLTASELNPAKQSLVRNAVIGAIGLNEGNGDVMTIGVAPIGTPFRAADSVSTPTTKGLGATPLGKPEPQLASWWFVPALLLSLLIGFFLFRPSRTVLSIEERDRFVKRIRSQLSLASEANDVGA